jgi:hypothetical protein
MAALPKVWGLLGTKGGGHRALPSLANVPGSPDETKQLVDNWPNCCANLLRGALLISLDCRKSSLQANARHRGVPVRAKGARPYLRI